MLKSLTWTALSLLALASVAASTQAQQPAKRSLRTPPSVDQPTRVSIGFYVLNLGKINQTDETFDIAGTVTTSWVDKRLAFSPSEAGENVVRYTPEQIWVPELTIVNSANLQRKTLIQLSVKPDGTVKLVEYIYVTVSSDFNLRRFPFDSQTAYVIWESLSSEVQPIELADNPTADGVSKDSYVGLSEWEILGVESRSTVRKAEKEDLAFPRHMFSMRLERNYAFYIFKVALPLLLICIISWTAFWINPSTAFVPQVNLGITSVLAAITFNLTISSALPRVPYATVMDGFIAICYVSFFTAILCTVYIHFMLNQQKTDRALGLLRRCRWLFPAAFVVVQAASLSMFLLR
jgi:hypothetical protein